MDKSHFGSTNFLLRRQGYFLAEYIFIWKSALFSVSVSSQKKEQYREYTPKIVERFSTLQSVEKVVLSITLDFSLITTVESRISWVVSHGLRHKLCKPIFHKPYYQFEHLNYQLFRFPFGQRTCTMPSRFTPKQPTKCYKREKI